jgi:hypothetical protein
MMDSDTDFNGQTQIKTSIAADLGLNFSVYFRVNAPAVPRDFTQPLLPEPGPGRPLLLHTQPQHQLTASACLPPLLPPAQEAAFRTLAPVNGLPSDIEIRLEKHLTYGDNSVCKTHKITKSQQRKIFLWRKTLNVARLKLQ